MLAQLGATAVIISQTVKVIEIAQNVTQANTPQGSVYVHIINQSY
jgi:hypothetical protein